MTRRNLSFRIEFVCKYFKKTQLYQDLVPVFHKTMDTNPGTAPPLIENYYTMTVSVDFTAILFGHYEPLKPIGP